MSNTFGKQLVYDTVYGEDTIVLDESTIKKFLAEASKVQGVYSDEGLYDFFVNFKDYKRVTAHKAKMVLGWPVINYILSDKALDFNKYDFDIMSDDGPKGHDGRVDSNTFGGAVMTGEKNYKKVDKLYQAEMERICVDLGWKIINWMGVGKDRKSKVAIIPSNEMTTMPGKVNENIDVEIMIEKRNTIREEKSNIKKLVAVYPGRFQPFGPHHLASYEFLKRRFDDVYIATSNKKGGARHPMSFGEKAKHMKRMGIPSKAIVQEKQPYIPKKILSKYDEDTTAVVFAVGEKDEGRLSGGKYFKPYRKNYMRLTGFNEHGYTLQLPHESVKVAGTEISGTTMRKLLGSDEYDTELKKKFFKKLFGYFDEKTFELFTTAFNEEIKLNVDVGDTILVGKFKNKKMVVKDIGVDKHGMPTVNGRKVTTFRYSKKPTSECITFAKKVNGNVVLGKNRDRNYSPNLRAVRELTGYGVELCYIMDNDTDWCEGVNSNGIGLVNSALFVKRDEKDFDKAKKSRVTSKDGVRIREALSKKTLKEAVESAVKYESGIKGHTMISDGKICVCIENTSRTSPSISIHDIDKESCVRTNHGIAHPEQGYTRGPDRVSSTLRMNNAKSIIDKIENASELFPAFYNHTQNKGPKYDLVRTQNKLWTSSQILMDLGNKAITLYLIPGAVRFSGVDNRLPKDYKSKISLEVRQYEHSPHDKYDTYVTTEPTQKKNAIKNKNIKVEQKELLLMGGAYGHMAHPFDDYGLTFGDLKSIIDQGLQGSLDKEEDVTEKLDGQNLMISMIDGKVVAARNKGDLKRGGMDIHGVMSKFKHHIPTVRDAFVFAMTDIKTSLQRVSDKVQKELFNNGMNWANIEIIYPATRNVIDYDGGAQIVFHGILKYDEGFNPRGEIRGGGKKLATIVNKVNGNIQKKFAFKGPNILNMTKSKDYTRLRGKFFSALSKLQNIYRLKDSDEVSLWHQMFWLEYILAGANSTDYPNITDDVLYPLMKRWAFSDKSFKMTQINKMKVDYPEFVDWVRATEKLDHVDMLKDNMKPFEKIFFELGVEIMSNVSNWIAPNPDKTVQQLRKDLDSAVKSIRAKADTSSLGKLNAQLKKIEAMGDLNKLSPTEGLVFKYKGKTYKFTGFFAPINQITGLMKFAR